MTPHVLDAPAGDARVVVPHRAHEDANRRTLVGLQPDTRVLEGLPRDLQRQPLLRVHLPRLPRADPEEGGVEGVHIRQEGPAAWCRHPGRLPPLRGRLGHRVAAFGQSLPEGLFPASPW